MLQPLSGEILPQGTNIEDEAILDIKARGFWGREEMAFFDVRIFNPFARSHINTNLEAVFRQNEVLKKKEYAERVIRVEHGTFTPIVLSAYGGYGLGTSKFIWGHPFRTSGLPGGGGVLKIRTSIVISQGILLLNPDQRGRGV